MTTSSSPRSRHGSLALGIIGPGEIVRMILSDLQKLEGAHVAAVAGSNADRAASLAREFSGATAYADYRELLADKRIEAVYIATPPFLHREMLAAALAAGKHVVCEKPLVMNIAELRELFAIRARYPEPMIAGCSSRFHVCPPVRAARELVAAGKLGRIQTVRVANSLELPPPLARLPAWKRTSAQSGGGLLADWGVYDLDWVAFLLGGQFEPIAVMGEVDQAGDEGSGLETGYAGRILCRNGLSVAIERRPEHGPRFQRAEIRGTDGGLDLPFMPGEGAPAALNWYRYENRTKLNKEVVSEPMCEWGPILSYPVVDFVKTLLHGGQVASPLARQATIHRVIEAWYESSRVGKSVPILAG